MTPDEHRLYARQISLLEVGVAGQERLLATTVRAAAGTDARVARWAEEYAARAGARPGPSGASIASAAQGEVRAIAGRPALEDAAAHYLGALGALEHVRRTVLGADARPLVPISLGPAATDLAGRAAER